MSMSMTISMNTSTPTRQLDLFDLINERHLQLRHIMQQQWHDHGAIPISNSEWMIMSHIYKKRATISAITKHVEISRQAVHKLIKKMESNGLIEVYHAEHNRKDRCLQLTPLGEQCYERMLSLKASLEDSIREAIGDKQMDMLKRVLSADWNI